MNTQSGSARPQVLPQGLLRIILFGLALLTLALYWPVGQHDFVSYDDPYYVTENP